MPFKPDYSLFDTDHDRIIPNMKLLESAITTLESKHQGTQKRIDLEEF